MATTDSKNIITLTNMEWDSMHCVIERNIVSDVYTPRDLVVMMQTARRNSKPYFVNQMDFSDFAK